MQGKVVQGDFGLAARNWGWKKRQSGGIHGVAPRESELGGWQFREKN
jgi:hypothetical protein